MGNISDNYIATIRSLSDDDKVSLIVGLMKHRNELISLIVGLMKHRNELKAALGCSTDARHEDVLKRATLCADRLRSP